MVKVETVIPKVINEMRIWKGIFSLSDFFEERPRPRKLLNDKKA